jgi:Fur family transcriptional regulator, peroxide stress response regulator
LRAVPEIIEQLHHRGMRVTPQRRLIISLLAERHAHPTVEDLYQQVKARLPDVSLATVYNTVHALVEMGELKVVEGLGGESIRYDTNTGQHHHLYCESCQQLVDVESNLGGFRLPEEKSSGYLINRSQVTFYGICPDCRNVQN